MNGGRLPHPKEPSFHPGKLPFAPPPHRAIPHYGYPSIVCNILSFAYICMHTFIHNMIVANVFTDYRTYQVAERSAMVAWGVGHLRDDNK
jgi:hypothetical protein